LDQYGAALPGKLVQTTLAGAANVAAQTGHRFDTTVTRWALANWVSDLPGFATPAELSYTLWRFRTRTFASLHQHGPTNFPLPYPLVPTASAGSAVSLSGTIRSGSGVYGRGAPSAGGTRVHAAVRGAARQRVRGHRTAAERHPHPLRGRAPSA